MLPCKIASRILLKYLLISSSEKEDRMTYRARFHLAEIINYARKCIFIKLYSMRGSKLLKEFLAIG